MTFDRKKYKIYGLPFFIDFFYLLPFSIGGSASVFVAALGIAALSEQQAVDSKAPRTILG